MSLVIQLLLCATLLLCPSRCQDVHKLGVGIKESEAHLAAVNQYPNFEEEMVSAMASLDNLWTMNLLELLENNSNSSMSRECYNSTLHLASERVTTFLPNVTLPAIVPLLDATGKQGAGLLGGNFILDAAFDECFQYNFTGYCMGKVKLSIIPVLSWTAGLCVPKHCSPYDVALLMNFSGVFKVDESLMKCTDSKFPAYSPGAIIMMVVCGMFVLMVATGTLLDLVLELITDSRQKDDYMIINDGFATISGSGEKIPLLSPVKQPLGKVKWHEFITAFSLYKTVPTLLATKQAPGVITSLNGLRVISMFWVILGHTYLFVAQNTDNLLKLKSVLSRFSFQVVGNAFFSVDTFFFLSGVLVAYLTLRQMKKNNGRFPFLHYYIHRYLRLTPTYAFVLFFAWFLTNHLAAGPTFPLVDSIGPACKKYWWTNLLYINNVYPWKMGEQCVGWTWYLANDMQFYIISPLILIPAYYLLPVGAVISSALLLCSFIVTATLSGVYNFQDNTLSFIAYNNPNTGEQDFIYEKPWSRIQPYIVGLALGYVLYRGIHFPFNRRVNWLLYLVVWIVSSLVFSSLLYGLYSTWHGHIPSTAENVFYLTFSRCAWGVGLALLVFACHNGYGGVINAFLSMKIWTPLSRMTFNAYLVHPIVLTVVYGQLQKSVHFTDITMATFTVAFVVLSYAVAGVVCVVVEFPLGSVEMLLFKLVGLQGRKSQRQQQAGEEKNGEEIVKGNANV